MALRTKGAGALRVLPPPKGLGAAPRGSVMLRRPLPPKGLGEAPKGPVMLWRLVTLGRRSLQGGPGLVRRGNRGILRAWRWVVVGASAERSAYCR